MTHSENGAAVAAPASKNGIIAQEVQALARANGGTVRPADLVEHARPPESPLHRFFEWDDSKAAERFRLHQAAGILRKVTVLLGPAGNQVAPHRMTVSLLGERGHQGGYRLTVDVLADEELRKRMLATALAELRIFQAKYAKLRGLSETLDKVLDTIPAATAGTDRGAPQ